MLIISQNTEIWVEHCPSGILTSCTILVAVLTVLILRVVTGSWSFRTGCWSLLFVLDEGVALVPWVESLKKFQVRFEVLLHPHLNPWTCAFWPQVIQSAAVLQ